MPAPDVWARAAGAPTVTQNLTERAIEDGRGFHASKRFEQLADDATGMFFLDNPTGSGVDLRFTQVNITGTADGYADIYADVTQTVAGTSIEIKNERIGDEGQETSQVTVEFGGTYTGRASDPYIEDVLPGGTKGAGSGGTTRSLSHLVREGHNLLVEITNKSGGPNDYGVLMFWIEEAHV